MTNNEMAFKMRIKSLFIILFPFLVSAQVTGLQGWDIFVDPGHSQNENMPPFSWAISEAKRNLRVALHLRDILLNETDIDTVYLSRTDDFQQVSLSQRSFKANSIPAQWYHSIHSDASSSPGANSTLLLWGQYTDGREKIPNGGKAMSDIMIEYLTDGMRTYYLQGSIGDYSFYSSWLGPDIPGPYLHVNRETTMPSELSESGFHTNPRQNQLFMNSDWLRLEARTFYWSILDFHNIPRPPSHILTGIIYDIESSQPLNGATITADGRQYITDTYESLFHQYTTDPDLLHNGFYYLENMDIDSVTVKVEAENYYTDSVRVAVDNYFFTFVDFNLVSTIPPYLVSSVPADGDTAVSVLDDMILRFNRPMNQAVVESLLVITPELPSNYFWSENGSVLRISSDSLKFLTTYSILIPGTVTDRYDHYFDGNADGIGGDSLLLTFTTGLDAYPPQVVSFYPVLYQKKVELKPVVSVEFDEEIDESSLLEGIFVLEHFESKQAVSGTLKHYAVNDRSVLNFFPDDKLIPGDLYVTRLSAGVQDLLGNASTTNYSISFNAATTDYQITALDPLEQGFSDYWWQPLGSGSTTGTNPIPGVYMEESQDVLNELTGSTRSLKLYYNWDLNASAWLIREYLSGGAPRSVVFDTSYTIQCYVFGDGSNNLFRFAIDDKVPVAGASNHEVSQWINIDWLGWRLVEWDLGDPESVGEWLGDGIPDGNLRFDSFQTSYQSGASASGFLYFDDLRLVKNVPATAIAQPYPLDNVPVKFSLEQNYPNPFNPLTEISFAVPKRVYVSLMVFNALGQIVTTLISEEKNPGYYRLQFDASNLASGMYIYRIWAGEFIQSRKMILMK
jgi:N-acetylmuramoyl-L-alanine amidase